MEIGHEIISTAILSPLIQIQVGQFKLSGLCLPRKSVVRFTDHLDMTTVVDWDVKQQNRRTDFSEIKELFNFGFMALKLTSLTVMILSFRTDRSGQTVYPGSTLLAILSASFGPVTL